MRCLQAHRGHLPPIRLKLMTFICLKHAAKGELWAVYGSGVTLTVPKHQHSAGDCVSLRSAPGMFT